MMKACVEGALAPVLFLVGVGAARRGCCGPEGPSACGGSWSGSCSPEARAGEEEVQLLKLRVLLWLRLWKSAPPKDVAVEELGLVVLLLATEGEREDEEQKEEAPA